MQDDRVRWSYHRVITLSLVSLNCLAILYAILDGDVGQRDYHFKEGLFITWLGSAQMLGAAFLFVACHLAGHVVDHDEERLKSRVWLVFAIGFFILALDQQFRIREQITLFIDGYPLGNGEPTWTHSLLKIVLTITAIGLVFYFRSIVLANFRMVLAFITGFWFLLLMILFDMLFESIGVPPVIVTIMEGSSKLLAMSMFLGASYAALIDSLTSAQIAAKQDRRRVGSEDISGSRRQTEIRQEMRNIISELPTIDDTDGLPEEITHPETLKGLRKHVDRLRQTIPDSPSAKRKDEDQSSTELEIEEEKKDEEQESLEDSCENSSAAPTTLAHSKNKEE